MGKTLLIFFLLAIVNFIQGGGEGAECTASDNLRRLTIPYKEYEQSDEKIEAANVPFKFLHLFSPRSGIVDELITGMEQGIDCYPHRDGYSARYAYSHSQHSIDSNVVLIPSSTDRDSKNENSYFVYYNRNQIGSCNIFKDQSNKYSDRTMDHSDKNRIMVSDLGTPTYYVFNCNINDNQLNNIKPLDKESLLVNVLVKIALQAQTLDPQCREVVWDQIREKVRDQTREEKSIENMFFLPKQKNFNRLKHFYGFSALDSVFYSASHIIKHTENVNMRFYSSQGKFITAQSARKYWVYFPNRENLDTSKNWNYWVSKNPPQDNEKIWTNPNSNPHKYGNFVDYLITALRKEHAILCQNGEVIHREANYFVTLNKARRNWLIARPLFVLTPICGLISFCGLMGGNIPLAGLTIPTIIMKYTYDYCKKKYKTIMERNRTPYHPSGAKAAINEYFHPALQTMGITPIATIGDNDGLVVTHKSSPLSNPVNSTIYDNVDDIEKCIPSIGSESYNDFRLYKNDKNLTPIILEAFPRPVPYFYDVSKRT